MGDITPLKILIVAVIALLVLGPERLPEMTRKAGKAWAEFKSFRSHLEAQVRDTVGDVPGFTELSKLSKLSSGGIKSTIASTVSSAMSVPTSAGPIGADISDASVQSSAPANSPGSAATVASVSSGPQPSVATPTSDYGSSLPGGGNGRPGQSRAPGAPRVSTGEPAFVADDPSFN